MYSTLALSLYVAKDDFELLILAFASFLWALGLQACIIIPSLCGIRDLTQGLMSATKALYQLSYILNLCPHFYDIKYWSQNYIFISTIKILTEHFSLVDFEKI